MDGFSKKEIKPILFLFLGLFDLREQNLKNRVFRYLNASKIVSILLHNVNISRFILWYLTLINTLILVYMKDFKSILFWQLYISHLLCFICILFFEILSLIQNKLSDLIEMPWIIIKKIGKAFDIQIYTEKDYLKKLELNLSAIDEKIIIKNIIKLVSLETLFTMESYLTISKICHRYS